MRYEDSWTLIGARALAHRRLDEAMNAWTLPAGPPSKIYLLNRSAAVQLTLEIFSFLVICSLMWKSVRHA